MIHQSARMPDLASMDNPHAGMDMTADPHAGMDMTTDPHAGLDMTADPHMGMGKIPMPNMAVSRSGLSWKTPLGWQEETTSGMRLATFKVSNAPSLESTIVSLGPESASLEPNIRRWAGQINIDFPTENALNDFLKSISNQESSSGLAFQFIDFTSLQNQSGRSMIAAIYALPSKTIFVKMTGQSKDLVSNREQFLSLCRSLKSE